jgi:hypothetical protein
MKNKIAKILLAILAITAPLAARASLYWYEGFQYTNGSVTTNSGGLWVRESGSATAPGDLYVNKSNLEVSATGGTISRQDDCDRLFVPGNGNAYTNLQTYLIYASFTIICTNLPNGAGSYFASFYNTNKGYCGRIQAFTNGTILPNTWRLGVTDNVGATNKADGGYPVDLALNTPYQVVEELDPVNLGAATIWINPININQTGFSPTETSYTASDSIGFQSTNEVNSYAFRQASSFGNSFFLITNLAAATTFAEAATNIWATNAVPPVVVYQPTAVTSNFVGSTFSLSVVANGQGLGNLTYQWQKSAVPANTSPANVSNPNGNSNILPFSSAQSTDSGYYTLVATTPDGLSATSSVAKVAISAAPVPPIFLTEPVSQTLYSGESVVFSTTVQSPGNISYQWYSNNAAIGGATASTLEIDNLITNYSASYKVAVTNDVVPNGIVSTNAVLTVLNPAVVSIAYLRTLVDPSTFLPTNTPPTIPYQVTGIVTTFTNLTSGNTASYYLQDGTAGINIFATFGSTFRPALGDVVTFVGVLSSFGGLELDADSLASDPSTPYPDTYYTDLSNDIAALPDTITIPYNVTNNVNYVNYTVAGSRVALYDAYFGTNAGTVISTNANEIVTVTNSSGQAFSVEFYDLDLDTAGQTLPAHAAKIIGVLQGGAGSSFSVAVTRFADIVVNAPASIPITIKPLAVPKGEKLEWTDLSSVFSLQFSTNVAGPYTTILGATSPYTNTMTTNAIGFYRLKW